MDIQWEELTISALKTKCDERGISRSGLKVDILNRLRDHDEKFPARLPPPEARLPRRNADYYNADYYRPRYESYRPEYENAFGQGRSPANVQHVAGTTRRQPEVDVQRDQQRSYNRGRGTNLTEAELEQICLDNYLPHESDRDGRVRKTEILTEYNKRSEEAKQQRAASISKAETKYKNDMAKLEKDKEEKLNQLNNELGSKMEKLKNWGRAFPQLQSLRSARGLRTRISDFAPRSYRLTSISPLSTSRSYPNPDSMSVASSSTAPPPVPSTLKRPHPNPDSMSLAPSSAAPYSVSFNLKRKASDTTLGSSSKNAPALRYRDSEDPFVDAPRTLQGGKDVDPEQIREQLVGNPYIFIPDTNICFRRDSIHHLKTLIENAKFYPKQVRADDTGYFIVFENSVRGDNQAALCFERFRGVKFMGFPMEMELNRKRI